MKLVVDTNILFKALIKNSKVRALLLNPNHQFYVPEYALEEVQKHLPLLKEKTKLSEAEIKLALSILLTNIRIIPSEDVSAKWNEANQIIGSIDKNDIPFAAASLSLAGDGIWSDDKDFKRQRRIEVFTTKEMIDLG